MELELLALRRGALGGDPCALAQLISWIRPAIVGTVRRVLRNKSPGWLQESLDHEVDDVAQNILSMLFERDARMLRAWDPDRGSLRTYCRQVARARTLDHLRRRSRRPWAERATMQDHLAVAAGPDPHLLEERMALIQLIRAALARVRSELTPHSARLFDLMFEQQRTTAELTQETGMSSSALDQRRSRMRRRLRTVMDELTA